MSTETKKTEIKKVSVKQAKEQSQVLANTMGLNADDVFNTMVSKGLVSAGRGCYTEGQEYFNTRYEEFKTKTLSEMKAKGLKCVNSKGLKVDIALNHKAVK